MKKGIIHGEVIVKESLLPEGAVKKATPKDYMVIAPSETTGNHHVIDCAEGIEFYEKEGVLYMKNEVPATVRCIHKERHDSITLEPSVWEVQKQQEYDYFTQSHRAVAD